MSSTTQALLTARPVGALACQMNSYLRSLRTRVVFCTAAATAAATVVKGESEETYVSLKSPACRDLHSRTIASSDQR